MRRITPKIIINDPKEPLSKGKYGYADWIIVAIHGLREHLGHSYRQLLNVIREMPAIVAKLGPSVNVLLDFTTVCARKQDLKMPIWQMLLQLSAELFDTEEVQVIDSTNIAHRSSSHNYTKRVKGTLNWLKSLFS